ncbi:MAG: hypothetical protein ACI9S8_002927, partial [Chlamydiales bacterium]
MTNSYNYSLSSFSIEALNKAPNQDLTLYRNLLCLDDIRYFEISGKISTLSIQTYDELNKRIAMVLNKTDQFVSKDEICQTLKKIHTSYEESRKSPFALPTSRNLISKKPLEITLPSNLNSQKEIQAIPLNTPRENQPLVEEKYSETLKNKVALFLNKGIQDTTDADVRYYQTVGKDIRNKDKAQKITSIARYLAISELQPYNPCADNLEPEERNLLISLGKEPLSLDDIPQVLPQKNEHGYWREVLTLTRNPLVIYKIARNSFSSKDLKYFPEDQHKFIIAASQALLHDSLYKVDFDRDIFETLYKPHSSPPEMLKSLGNNREKNSDYTTLATKILEREEKLQTDRFEGGCSYLDKLTHDIASLYAPSDKLIHETSFTSIHEYLVSIGLEGNIQKLSSDIKGIRTAFDLEIFCINYHKLVYNTLDKINNINVTLKRETLGKEITRMVAGEDQIIPLSIYLIQRMNDPEVYAKLTALEKITDDSFLELHSRHIFARTIGSACYALDELKTNFQILQKELRTVGKKARYSCFGL